MPDNAFIDQMIARKLDLFETLLEGADRALQLHWVELRELIQIRIDPLTPAADVHKCRVCGCTDDDCRGCIERTGEPCHWVERTLCSACSSQAEGETSDLPPVCEFPLDGAVVIAAEQPREKPVTTPTQQQIDGVRRGIAKGLKGPKLMGYASVNAVMLSKIKAILALEVPNPEPEPAQVIEEAHSLGERQAGHLATNAENLTPPKPASSPYVDEACVMSDGPPIPTPTGPVRFVPMSELLADVKPSAFNPSVGSKIGGGSDDPGAEDYRKLLSPDAHDRLLSMERGQLDGAG